jgi:hypothetical protein
MGKWRWKGGGGNFHAEGRAFTRYGVKLSWVECLEIRDRIEQGKARFVSKDVGGHCSTYVVEHKGRAMTLVYDRQRRKLVTFLPDQTTEIFFVEVRPTVLQRVEIWLLKIKGARKMDEIATTSKLTLLACLAVIFSMAYLGLR